MARKLKSDKWLFLSTLLLVCSSVVMVYSASAPLAMDQYAQPYFFLFKQIAWVVLGVFLLLLTTQIDYRIFKQPIVVWTALGVSVIALLLVLNRPAINGTNRWFNVAGIGVQPSEFAKLAVVFFVAAMLEKRMDRINDVSYSLLPIAVAAGVVTGLIYWATRLRHGVNPPLNHWGNGVCGWSQLSILGLG